MFRLRSGFLLGVVLALPLQSSHAQDVEVVTLQNGAVFEGIAVLETTNYLDLQVGKGRIRLFKRWIETRVKPHGGFLREAAAGGANGAGGEAAVAIPPRKSLFPDSMRDGATHLRPIHNLHRYAPKTSSAEEVAVAFAKYFQRGRGADAVENLANPMRLLDNAFPNVAKGLTSYSRRLAARLLVRVIVAACGRRGIKEALESARMTQRELKGPRGTRLIEISYHRGTGTPVVAVIGIDGGKIVDLTSGPPPIPQVISEIRLALKASGNKPWHLVPMLERVVLAEIARSLPSGENGGDPVDSTPLEVWSLRPKERRYVLTLPWAWEPAEGDETPEYADILIHTQDGKCAAMAVTERGDLPLAKLKSVVLYQLRKSLGKFEVSGEEETTVNDVRALRFRVRTKALKTPLTYEILLIVIQGRACQFAAWCRTEDEKENGRLLDAMFSGLRFLN
ncbi:MAG: hypothetical protein CMJ83_17165 [Planctomycetes bacterium]|nr:hypothetical protein [Planctomycetota bacterium]